MTLSTDQPIHRVAMLSVHGCPLMMPGVRSAGGMNVYLRKIAPLLAEREVCVDVFTRNHHAGGPEFVELGPNARVVHLPAGAPELSKDEIVPFDQSVRMYQALEKAGVPVELHTYGNQPHGFDAQPEYGRQTAATMLAFLRRFVTNPAKVAVSKQAMP